MDHLDLCPFQSFTTTITNKGNITSDYVALAFLSGNFGPVPYPRKSLVAYQRLFDIAPATSKTANFKLTLGRLSRVDDKGNTILYPGEYMLAVDIQPLAKASFVLTGDAVILDHWPQPNRPFTYQ